LDLIVSQNFIQKNASDLVLKSFDSQKNLADGFLINLVMVVSGKRRNKSKQSQRKRRERKRQKPRYKLVERTGDGVRHDFLEKLLIFNLLLKISNKSAKNQDKKRDS
jgi:hypothetical protein